MQAMLRVCANCRVLVQPAGAVGPDDPFAVWEHVPEFAAKFTRAVCFDPDPGREPSGSEARFGLARAKTASTDKLKINEALPEMSRPDADQVTVAVDGSYKLHVGDRVVKPMSWGYVTDTGLYGLGTSLVRGSIVGGRPMEDGSGRDPERSLQAELRAMANALKKVGRESTVTLLTDSRDAMDFMLLWRAGHEVMPGGYNLTRAGGRESTLGRLARRALESGDRITVQWVPGHAGHPLNECADALAKMARAWATGRIDKDTAAGDAARVVRAALALYGAGCAA